MTTVDNKPNAKSLLSWLVFTTLLLLIPWNSAEAYIGNLPNYSMLNKADVVVLVDPKDLLKASTVIQRNDPWGSPTVEVEAKVVKGHATSPIRFISDDQVFVRRTPPPSTLIIFLGQQDDGSLIAVNRMGSTIPTSLTIQEIEALAGGKLEGCNVLDLLPEIFAKEANDNSALLQSTIIAGGPKDLSMKAWKLTGEPDELNPRLLAHTLVGLNASGAAALKESKHLHDDLSKIGQVPKDAKYNPGGINPSLVEHVRSYIAIWSYYHAKEESDIETLLDFALAQHGRFQADLIHNIAKQIPENRLPDILSLIATSKDARVRYSCYQTIIYVLKGSGLRGADDFAKHQGECVRSLEPLLNKHGLKIPDSKYLLQFSPPADPQYPRNCGRGVEVID